LLKNQLFSYLSFSIKCSWSLTLGRDQGWIYCILPALHTLELQEHSHDCTPNDLLAAYAALALRPLATSCFR